MVRVEQWAEIRRMHFVARLGIREIARRLELSRATVRRALRSDATARYERAPVACELDPHKQEIHCLLWADPRLSAARIRELIADQGLEGLSK